MIDFSKLPRFNKFTFEITGKIYEWSQTFEVDAQEIERQILYAHGWIDNNPKKGPKKDIMRFIYNWLLIAKRKGSLIAKRKDITYKEPAPEEEVMTADDFKKMREEVKKNQTRGSNL